jgi:hypothetical protein
MKNGLKTINEIKAILSHVRSIEDPHISEFIRTCPRSHNDE